MFRYQQYFVEKIAVSVAILFLCAAPALAIHPDTKAEIENLKKRIEALESQQKSAVPTNGQDLDFGQFSKYVTLHGLLEADAFYAQSGDSDDESDLTLATAELSIEATLSEMVGGHVILLYEEEAGEDDDIDIDEAVLSLTSPTPVFGQTASVHVGRMYVPFGMFNSFMVSDPLTLELGETRKTAALFALTGDVWVLKAGVFNGDADADGDNNHIDNFVASLELRSVENLAFGVSYINDLAESDRELVQDTDLYSGNVAGASAFLSARWGQFDLELEYLAALDAFDRALIAPGDGLTGKRPEAWNFELAWMPVEKIQLAVRYEAANDFQDDVQRYGATASYGLHKNVVVALEYLRADADVAVDDTVDVVTAQLALEF
ncbi:MAG: LbtU family siderophore porin [Desulfuromonadales bacterium]|nr:LbtU family siderophore porin [Desulfuromonadales bacterium]